VDWQAQPRQAGYQRQWAREPPPKYQENQNPVQSMNQNISGVENLRISPGDLVVDHETQPE
jgi:hypothetical protein